MEKIKLLLLGCLLIVLNSCMTENELSHSQSIALETKTDKIVRFKDVFESSKILPLEHNPRCMLSDIYKIIQFDHKYFISGSMQTLVLYVFDAKGKYRCKIGQCGKGHGEYINPSDFTIDKRNKRVVILDSPSKVLVYDFNGKFLYSKKLTEASFYKIFWKDGRYFCSTQNYPANKNLLYVYDSNFQYKGSTGKPCAGAFTCMPLISSVLQSDGKSLYYFDEADESVYSYNDNSLEKSYTFNLPNPMPFEKRLNQDVFMHNELKYDLILDALITQNRMLVSYTSNKRFYISLKTLDNKSIVSGWSSFSSQKMFLGEKDMILIPISAFDYLQLSKYEELPKTAKKVAPGDNFLIMKCVLK